MVQGIDVRASLVTIVPVKLPIAYLTVCVKLDDALVIVIVVCVPIMPLVIDMDDFLGIVSKVPVPLPLTVPTQLSNVIPKY